MTKITSETEFKHSGIAPKLEEVANLCAHYGIKFKSECTFGPDKQGLSYTLFVKSTEGSKPNE